MSVVSVTQCDRCGNQVEPRQVRSFILEAHHDKHFDLCVECWDQFHAWFVSLGKSLFG